MAAQIIDGKLLAAGIKREVSCQVQQLKQEGISPKLVVFLVGNNSASSVYVRGKEADCLECGIISEIVALPEETTQEELLKEIVRVNQDVTVHGVLVQLPLPNHIDTRAVIEEISPEKDVDGFHPVNIGRMQLGEDCFLPCTPAGCMEMLAKTGIDIEGKQAVVVGRSNIVGKPVSMMLLEKNATVTICHSKTEQLAEKCLEADILIAAVGKANVITKDMVKPGAVVIDVGMNRNVQGKLCGDVDFEEICKVASFITPVPGGVGLMTRAILLKNTIKAAQNVLELIK